jgi:hypothetical protein
LGGVVVRRPREIETLRESIVMEHVRMMEANFFLRFLVDLFAARRATIKSRSLCRDPRPRGFLLLSGHGLFGRLGASPRGSNACKVAAIVRSMASRASNAEIDRGATEPRPAEVENVPEFLNRFLTHTVQALP